MSDEFNTRLLIVDDEELVRDSFREIFRPSRADAEALSAAEAALFDDVPAIPRDVDRLDFETHFAENGPRALGLVRAAADEGRPFAVIFLDMRMPGWDGLETAERIRAIDQHAEIVFITAFSDHTIEDIVERAGANVGYRCKPFAPEEIRQLATKCVYDWNKLRSLERLIHLTSSLSAHASAVDVLLSNVLHQVTEWLGASSSLLIALEPGGPRPLNATGKMCSAEVSRAALRWVERLDRREVCRADGLVYFPLAEYAIATIIEDGTDLRTEKLYLLRLFLQHAAVALENARLSVELLRAQKLSAVGSALSQVVHDLKQPLSVIQLAALVARDETDEVVRDAAFASMQSASETMAGYVNDLLDFTANAQVHPAEHAVHELLTDVARETARAARDAAVAVDEATRVDLRFDFDARKLRRVLVNLVVNALEAMREARTPGARVGLGASVDERGRVCVTVRDNGPGIPQAIAATAFEPFVTHGKAHGTGLGLAIARQIVEAHGGTIRFESAPGETTFRLEFPLRAGGGAR